jgi:hypothetical protein
MVAAVVVRQENGIVKGRPLISASHAFKSLNKAPVNGPGKCEIIYVSDGSGFAVAVNIDQRLLRSTARRL